jgi:hypothetical protein
VIEKKLLKFEPLGWTVIGSFAGLNQDVYFAEY